MDTSINSRGVFRFVVLIPHKDVHKPLAGYRETLFAAGFHGAYSFPLCAPLALVSRPLSGEELKALARNIRERADADNGKIRFERTASAVLPEQCAFFGPCLDFSIEEAMFPDSAREKIVRVFSPPVLCAALLEPAANSGEEASLDKAPAREEVSVPPCPSGGFRAAALANLATRPLRGGELAGAEIAAGGITGADRRGGQDPAPAFFSREWKTGPLVWLPAYKKAKPRCPKNPEAAR